MRIITKIIAVILVSIFCCKNANGFDNSINKDSLEHILNQNNDGITDKEKIQIRVQLAEFYLKYNVNQSIDLINQNLRNTTLSQFPELQAQSFYLKGRGHLLISDLAEAASYLSKAKDYFYEKNEFVQLGNCYKDLGTIKLYSNLFDEAEAFYKKGIVAYQKGNYSIGVAHCNLNLGNVYSDQFSFAKGIQFYYHALKEYEAQKLNRYIGMVNNNIGNIYKDIKNYSKAHEHYQKAKHSYQIDNDSLQIINANLNIGATYLDQGEYDLAIQILYKALYDTKKIGFNYPIPTIYNNIVACHINLGNFDLAENNIQLALQISNANGTNTLEEINSSLLASEIQFRQKKYSKAINLAHLTLNKAKEKNQWDVMANASKILANAYKKKNQYKESLLYLELHESLKDSLYNEEEIKIPLAKDFEYQLEKQKREQEVEQEKNKLAYEAELKSQKNILFFFGLGFFILSAAVIAFYKNFKERKRAEKELEKKNAILEKYIESNIQLEQFAHIASHDLKSPLRTVGSFSSLLKRRAGSKLNESEMEYLDMIGNAAKLMWNLVDDLMAYSQVNSLQMNLEQHDVNTLLEDVQSNLNFSIEEKSAVLQINNMPKAIMIDETKIRQVFQNLIANSLKFTPIDTTPFIKINCTPEKYFYKFSISDNGIGIQEEYLETIFKPYKQLHTKDKYEGTGMGLAICKKIVEKHGGEISVESELDKGTTFYFTIPITTSTTKRKEEEMMSIV